MNACAHSVLIWLAVGNCVAVLVVIADNFDKYLFGIVLTSIFFYSECIILLFVTLSLYLHTPLSSR